MVERLAELSKQLLRVMVLRVALITLFLGSNFILSWREADPFSQPGQQALLWLVGLTYGLTIVYALSMERLRAYLDAFALVQLVVDLALVHVVVRLTGQSESSFMFLYSLVALAAAILLSRRRARFILVLAVALIGLGVGNEVLDPHTKDVQTIQAYQAGFTHLSAVLLIAFLGGYLSEQLRATGSQLEAADAKLRGTSADLRAERALNANLIASIHSGLFGYAMDGQIIFFNPSAERITGRLADEVIGLPAESLFVSLVAQPETPEVLRWEALFERTDGSMRNLGMSRSALMDGTGQQVGWIVIFRDLSRIRQLEMRIRRSEKFAAIGRMAAGIAHEIRNPLASMSGSIQMLQTGELEPMQARLMDIVLREIDRLNQLISDFLQFARPAPPTFERVDLGQLIDEVQAMFGAHREAVSLVVAAEDCVLTADAGQLRQVFWNLLINAADAMPDGGAILLRIQVEPGAVQVQVQDEGVGIAPDVLEHIFDPFYTTKPEGTGLGLAQAHRIVEEHGGTLEVDSTLDVGTTFTVRLPRARVSRPMVLPLIGGAPQEQPERSSG
jgi:two-component system sensor histidine kinase PilS (NtrC family)